MQLYHLWDLLIYGLRLRLLLSFSNLEKQNNVNIVQDGEEFNCITCHKGLCFGELLAYFILKPIGELLAYFILKQRNMTTGLTLNVYKFSRILNAYFE